MGIHRVWVRVRLVSTHTLTCTLGQVFPGMVGHGNRSLMLLSVVRTPPTPLPSCPCVPDYTTTEMRQRDNDDNDVVALAQQRRCHCCRHLRPRAPSPSLTLTLVLVWPTTPPRPDPRPRMSDNVVVVTLAIARHHPHLGKSTGNLRVSGAVPVPNPPKNLYPLCRYGFSNGYAAGDPYSYPHGFTHRYEQMGSTCQRARIHLQTVILCVHALACMCKGIGGGRPCHQGEGEGEVVVERVRVRVRAMARHYHCCRHPRRSVVDLALSLGRGQGHIIVVIIERERERARHPERG